MALALAASVSWGISDFIAGSRRAASRPSRVFSSARRVGLMLAFGVALAIAGAALIAAGA